MFLAELLLVISKNFTFFLSSYFPHHEYYFWPGFSSVQFSPQLCPTLSDPIHCSMPDFAVYHQLPELAQIHVHWIGDAIQPSHPLSSPFPPDVSLSQHQGFFPVSHFFALGGQSIGASASASVLLMNIQNWFLLGLTGLISLLSKWLSRVFSNTTAQKHKFFSVQPSLRSNSHMHTLWLEKL